MRREIPVVVNPPVQLMQTKPPELVVESKLPLVPESVQLYRLTIAVVSIATTKSEFVVSITLLIVAVPELKVALPTIFTFCC